MTPPVLGADRVFVVAGSTASVFDLRTGDEQWSVPLPNDPGASTAFGSGLFFVSTRYGDLFAFDAATGAQRWAFEQPYGYGLNGLTSTGDRVFVNGGSRLFALAAGDGRLLWSAPADVSNAPSVAGGRVIANGACHSARAFDAHTGEALWRHRGGCVGGGGPTPALHDDLVSAPELGGEGTGLILDARSGAVRTSTRFTTVPALASDRILPPPRVGGAPGRGSDDSVRSLELSDAGPPPVVSSRPCERVRLRGV